MSERLKVSFYRHPGSGEVENEILDVLDQIWIRTGGVTQSDVDAVRESIKKFNTLLLQFSSLPTPARKTRLRAIRGAILFVSCIIKGTSSFQVDDVPDDPAWLYE